MGVAKQSAASSREPPRSKIPDAEVVEGEIGIPLDAEALGAWLKAPFGDPITTGTGPYAHEFRSGGWDLLGFAVEIGMPDVPHYALDAGCKTESLSWTMARSPADDPALRPSPRCVGQSRPPVAGPW